MDDMEKMENDNIIVLTDEDGIDVEFEFCASIEYEGNEYVANIEPIAFLLGILHINKFVE